MLHFHEDLAPIQLSVDSTGFVPVVRIDGELDIATAPRVRGPLVEAARRGAPPFLVVELSELTFCGSIGLAELLSAQRAAEQHGGQVVLVGCRPELIRLLRLAGVQELFVLVATMTEVMSDTVTLPNARRPSAADETEDSDRRQ
jgi:anti-anti-sigma factor